ncbi:hypothetical protein EDB83DRAFT_2321015 [Lactarius deliciosus]|nr:hypothetical protein EDB83DRAFT_2321015 [Lactarius deliciosus]
MALKIEWNGLYSTKKTQRPFVVQCIRAHFFRMKLWERNMTSASIRPTGWHGEGGLERWGHLTVDFHEENGVHVTTHHMYPTEGAYRFSTLGELDPSSPISHLVAILPVTSLSHYHCCCQCPSSPLYHVTVAAMIAVTQLMLVECSSGSLASASKPHKWRKKLTQKSRYNRNTPTHKNESTIIECEAEAQNSNEYARVHEYSYSWLEMGTCAVSTSLGRGIPASTCAREYESMVGLANGVGGAVAHGIGAGLSHSMVLVVEVDEDWPRAAVMWSVTPRSPKDVKGDEHKGQE